MHVYQYSHACSWHHACIFVCNIVYLQSMAQNWCSLWHSLIGQSPLLQGGIMADWVCTKAGEEKGESREKERKWKHVCKKKNPSRWQDGDCSHTETKSTRHLAAFASKGQERQNSQIKKFGVGGFTGMNMFNYSSGAVIRYGVSPKWIFPSGGGDKIRLRNGFCLCVDAFSVLKRPSVGTIYWHRLNIKWYLPQPSLCWNS